MDEYQPNSGLNSTQKTGFVLLLVFGILAVGLGGLQLRNYIYSPFANMLASTKEAPDLILDETARLQTIDTDKDGINDWEELNFYETSPYLPDTDSDGVGDKQELDAGEDPLCPQGEKCLADEEIIPLVSSTVQLSPLVEQAGLGNILGVTDTVGEPTANLNTENFFELFQDPAQLRQIILSSGGMTPEQLSQIDDQTLLKLVGDIMAGTVPLEGDGLEGDLEATSTIQ